ncbi:MAG: hypothetical protein ACLFPJ_04385 [Candidatus Woesearchaeota archaeon]
MLINKYKKSQTYSLDAIIALIIFITIFLSITKIWDYSVTKINDNENRNDFELVIRNSFNGIFSASGNPSNWYLLDNLNETKSLGVISNNKLNLKKLDKLMKEENYNETKKLIGLIGPRYEFKINLLIYNENLNIVNNINYGFKNNCTHSIILNKIKPINNTNFAFIKFTGCILE